MKPTTATYELDKNLTVIVDNKAETATMNDMVFSFNDLRNLHRLTIELGLIPLPPEAPKAAIGPSPSPAPAINHANNDLHFMDKSTRNLLVIRLGSAFLKSVQLPGQVAGSGPITLARLFERPENAAQVAETIGGTVELFSQHAQYRMCVKCPDDIIRFVPIESNKPLVTHVNQSAMITGRTAALALLESRKEPGEKFLTPVMQ